MRSGEVIKLKTLKKGTMFYLKNILIYSHDLRRSFATNYFGNISTLILLEITRHKKESTFKIYVGVTQNKDSIADTFMELTRALV
jgi:hypothetical protein